MTNELQTITQLIDTNFNQINNKLEKYNKRIDKLVNQKQKLNITYDQLAANILQITGEESQRNIKIRYLDEKG